MLPSHPSMQCKFCCQDYGTESPNSGRALRTGRTAEGYTDARELSAKQRSNMPRTKSTPNTTG